MKESIFPKYKRGLRGLVLYSFLINIVFLSPFALWSADSTINTGSENDRCPNKFPNLITDVCWKSLFPIKIGGNTIITMSQVEDNVNYHYNADDANPDNPLCFCTKNGLPAPGVYGSFWEPARVIETVRKPFCFPFLFGEDMGMTNNLWGALGVKSMNAPGDKAFWNVHVYNFPLIYIMQLIGILNGCVDISDQFDLLSFTELDPLWNDDEFSFFSQPESAVFANPVAQALCSIDCVTATAGWPLNAEFWCAGCWGSLYPYTGNTTSGTQVVDSALMSTRILAAAARRGVPFPELVSSGTGAKCGAYPSFMIKKSQYKMSMLKPIPMTSGKCSFPIGRSTIVSSAEYRSVPGTGEDYIWMLWKKKDCCVLF